MKSSSC